jgi:hypothetical protein
MSAQGLWQLLRLGTARRPERPDLPAPTVRAVLLFGWGILQTVDRVPTDARAPLAALWKAGAPGIARLWREHEAELRAEAARLKLRPTWPARTHKVYFGEYVALRVRPSDPTAARPA